MKNGWQMNGRWKKVLKQNYSKEDMRISKFDRMIPSGSSWLIGVKVKRVVGRAHSMIERGKKIPIQKLHYMMGHTGKHLINPTTKFWVFRPQEN